MQVPELLPVSLPVHQQEGDVPPSEGGGGGHGQGLHSGRPQSELSTELLTFDENRNLENYF